MKQREIFGGIYLVTLVFIILYTSGGKSLLVFFCYLVTYGCIAYAMTRVWRKIAKKDSLVFSDFIIKFLSGVGWSVLMLLGLVGGFCYYKNEISPAKMPVYSLTNGEKRIIFQTMSHIGTQQFYENVIANIKEKKEQGFVLFFEGVQEGSQENMARFDQAIGIEFDADLYKNFSKLYGVTHQNNEMLLGHVNNLDFNVDLGIDEIMDIYTTKGSHTGKAQKPAIDASREISNILSHINERELKVLVYLNQAILNTIIASEGLRENILKISGTSDIFDIILHDRNLHLVETLHKSEYNNIIITYGLMHFEGVFSLLKTNDPRWHIEKINFLYPIQ